MQVHMHIFLLFSIFCVMLFSLGNVYSYFSTDKAAATIKITACGYYNRIKQSSVDRYHF